MTEKHKPRRDETDTTIIEPGLISEEEFNSLTRTERQRAFSVVRLVMMERAERFVNWYMGLKHGSDVKIGLGVNADIRAPKAIIVLCEDVTWHFTADEVVFLVHALEDIQSRFTAATGKDVPMMTKYLVHGLRICYGKLVDFSADEIDEMEDGLQEDEYGRPYFDQNVRDLSAKRRPQN